MPCRESSKYFLILTITALYYTPSTSWGTVTSNCQRTSRGEVPPIPVSFVGPFIGKKYVCVWWLMVRDKYFFWSCLNRAMNYTDDVCQFKSYFCNLRKSQFVVRIRRMVKYHFVLCKTAQLTTSLVLYSRHQQHQHGHHQKK